MADNNINYGWAEIPNNYYEIQRNNNYEIRIDNLAAIVGNVHGTGLGGKSISDAVRLCVESFPLPNVTIDPIVVPHGNSKIRIAGAVGDLEGDLVVRDAIEPDIEAIINAWHRSVYDPATDKIGWAKKYKTTATVTQYAPDGSNARSWQLKGVWPSTVNYGDLNYDGSEKKTITMTLVYDKAILKRSYGVNQDMVVAAGEFRATPEKDFA